ncbi:MAG: zinc-ribbon domain-containing protein, partial [Lachnospiraceae bacterium]|nr:zinc-ribbon domain-containing protein [Lachnospiraceae bacterium]
MASRWQASVNLLGGHASDGRLRLICLAGDVIIPGGGFIMFCTKCGKELKEGTKFCTACGAEVKRAGASGDGEVKKAGSADKIGIVNGKALFPIIAIAACVVTLIICVTVVLVTLKPWENKKSDTDTTGEVKEAGESYGDIAGEEKEDNESYEGMEEEGLQTEDTEDGMDIDKSEISDSNAPGDDDASGGSDIYNDSDDSDTSDDSGESVAAKDKMYRKVSDLFGEKI